MLHSEMFCPDIIHTALHFAALSGHAEAIAKLLDLGADIHARNLMNGTALHYAAGEGLDLGEDEDGRSFADCVEVLLKRGAGANSKMHYNQTPLHHAAGAGKDDHVSLLVSTA